MHQDRRTLVHPASRQKLVREPAVFRPVEGMLLDPLGLAARQVRHSTVLTA
jgi:hypothetical protein